MPCLHAVSERNSELTVAHVDVRLRRERDEGGACRVSTFEEAPQEEATPDTAHVPCCELCRQSVCDEREESTAVCTKYIVIV